MSYCAIIDENQTIWVFGRDEAQNMDLPSIKNE
jgi:hypothetical protein